MSANGIQVDLTLRASERDRRVTASTKYVHRTSTVIFGPSLGRQGWKSDGYRVAREQSALVYRGFDALRRVF